MEPNENPNFPVNDSPTSDKLGLTELTNNKETKVFGHEKVITPLNSNIHPEKNLTPKEVSAAVNNVASPVPLPTEFTQTQEIIPTLSSVTPQEEIVQKPVSSKRREILEPLFVLVLAIIAGAIFHLWYRLTIKILPNSISICSNSTNDGISLACQGTLLGNFAAYITLFSLVSYICYLVIKKSNLLPFYYGGFFVGILFFIETALVLNLAAAYKLRWLFDHGSFWANWILPGLVSGAITIIFYIVIKYTQPFVKTVLGFVLTGFILFALIFMPGLVNDLISQQNKAGIRENKNKTVENIKNSDIKIYAPKNYNGPLKLSSAQSLIGLSDLIPRYELFYDFPNPIPNQPDDTIVHIYKGSTNDFNPPTNCGDGSPSSEKSKSELEYPCKVVLTTKRGRDVYGHRSPLKLQKYNIDPGSDDIKKIQPDNFYIPIGDDVISFSDPSSAEYRNESPFTPSIIEEFVDSLEPLSGSDLEQFIDQYIL